MNYSFNGWKSPAVRPHHVNPRPEWWEFYCQADRGLGMQLALGDDGHYMGEFLFKNGKAFVVEEGKERELSLWK